MRKINNLGKIGIGMLIFVTAFVLAGVGYLFVSPADALALQNRKDTLQTSAFGTLARHTFVFTTQTALTTDATAGADFSFVINFPVGGAGTDPFSSVLPTFVAGDFTATCTSCASQVMAVTAVEASNNGGNASNDEFLIAINETGQDSNPLPAASIVTLTFGAVTGAQRLTNPANDHAGCTAGGVGTADICRITINTSEAITGTGPTTVDNGDVLIALIEGVTVSASIAESLSFVMANGGACAGDTGTPAPTANSTASTATSVTFGEGTPSFVSPNEFYVGCQDLTVTTNAGTGYTVTGEANTSLRDNTLADAADTIVDTSCDAASVCTQTTGGAWTNEDSRYGFGFACENITGTPCDAAGDAFSEYRQFACISADADDCVNFAGTGNTGETAVAVLSGISAVNGSVGRVHYKLSVSGTQSAGVYNDSFLTYIAAGTF